MRLIIGISVESGTLRTGGEKGRRVDAGTTSECQRINLSRNRDLKYRKSERLEGRPQARRYY
jgi:hypothetical protein